MSTETKKSFPLIGRRMEKERERLGITQEAIGVASGASRETWKNWIAGKTYPNAMNLVFLGEHGFDVPFILFGVSNEARQDHDAYHTPARDLAESVAVLPLSTEDAEMIYSFARRLAHDK